MGRRGADPSFRRGIAQYVSVAFTAELIGAGIAGLIDTVGDALDSARAMRIDHRAVQDRGDQPGRARLDQPARGRRAGRPLPPLVQHWSNTERLHSSIGHLPPIEFEDQYQQARTETPDRDVA